jgi:hypothetical protein
MKYILIILTLSITTYNCKAQSPILNMESDGVTKMDMPDNAYYKDVNNELDNFDGTGLYTGLNSSLKIVRATKTAMQQSTTVPLRTQPLKPPIYRNTMPPS